MYVFSGSIPALAAGRCYDKLGAYARLFHDGDFARAAKAAVSAGFLKPRPRPSRVSMTFDGRPIGDGYRSAPERAAAGAVDAPPSDGKPGSDSPEPRFRFVSSAELAGGDYRPTWLVPRILVKDQPGVIAGPSKSMKTSALIDLAVSLASGRSFLGEFEVPKPFRVAVVSGESGAHTIQETARRVCKARGVDLAGLERLQWCFDLPTLANVGVMAEFAEGLTRLGAEVVIIDPLYLALGGDIDHANMFEMGAALRVAAEVLLKAGITPILVHHANRQLKVGEQMELTHLAYSGLEQFARQFLLVNRREPYRSDGVHELWLRAGGSAGHGGLWGVHIEEGITDGDFGGREWNVTVQTTAEASAGVREQKEQARQEKKRATVRADGPTVLKVIDSDAAAGRMGSTLGRIKELTGFRHDKGHCGRSGSLRRGRDRARRGVLDRG